MTIECLRRFGFQLRQPFSELLLFFLNPFVDPSLIFCGVCDDNAVKAIDYNSFTLLYFEWQVLCTHHRWDAHRFCQYCHG